LTTASAEEVASPIPYSVYAAPTEHEALASDVEEIELVMYNVTLAEMKEDRLDDNVFRITPARRTGLLRRVITRPTLPPANPEGLLVPFWALEKGVITGFAFTASNDATRALIGALESRDKLSILTRPQVAGTVGTPIDFVVGYGTSNLEMKLLPVRLEDGAIPTEIEVKRTETIDGKEETHQWEMSVSAPTENQSSLVIACKLDGKEYVLFVTAWLSQTTVPVTVAQSVQD